MPTGRIIERQQKREGPHSGASRFDDSIEYASDAEQEYDAEHASELRRFVDSIDYSGNAKDGAAHTAGERVLYVGWHPGISRAENAALEMEAVARQARCADPVAHMVLSYDSGRGENPSFEQIDLHVRMLLVEHGFTSNPRLTTRERIGLDGKGKAALVGQIEQGDRPYQLNQYIYYVHGDTKNLHVHIVANRVGLNGTVNPWSFAKKCNEHIAADIAGLENWEMVAGRHNVGKVLAQARERGASQAEIEALERHDAATLDRVRELHAAQAAGQTVTPQPRQTVAQKAQARNGRQTVHLSPDECITIQKIFERSDSRAAFEAAMTRAGFIIKFGIRLDRNGKPMLDRNGHVVAGVSFADATDTRGSSGTKVGVTARQLMQKFGEYRFEQNFGRPEKFNRHGEKVRPQDQQAPASFVDRHRATVQVAFQRHAGKSTFAEFQRDCEAAGLIIHYKMKKGGYPTVRVTDLDGTEADSGKKFGIEGKVLLAAFPELANGGRSTGPVPLGPEEAALRDRVAVLHAAAMEKSRRIDAEERSGTEKLLKVASMFGLLRGARQQRAKRRERMKKDLVADSKRLTSLTGKMAQLQRERERLQKMAEWLPADAYADKLAAIEVRAEYERRRVDWADKAEAENKVARDAAFTAHKAKKDRAIWAAETWRDIKIGIFGRKYSKVAWNTFKASRNRIRAEMDLAWTRRQAELRAQRTPVQTYAEWLAQISAGAKDNTTVARAAREMARMNAYRDRVDRDRVDAARGASDLAAEPIVVPAQSPAAPAPAPAPVVAETPAPARPSYHDTRRTYEEELLIRRAARQKAEWRETERKERDARRAGVQPTAPMQPAAPVQPAAQAPAIPAAAKSTVEIVQERASSAGTMAALEKAFADQIKAERERQDAEEARRLEEKARHEAELDRQMRELFAAADAEERAIAAEEAARPASTPAPVPAPQPSAEIETGETAKGGKGRKDDGDTDGGRGEGDGAGKKEKPKKPPPDKSRGRGGRDDGGLG